MVSMRVGPSASAGRKSFSHLPQILEVPNLIEVQLNSFRWFQEKGLKQLFEEISPIKDFTGNRLELSFVDYEFREPRLSEMECTQRDQTYSITLYVKARLLVKGKETPAAAGDLRKGDTVEVATPRGAKSYEILKVEWVFRFPQLVITEIHRDSCRLQRAGQIEAAQRHMAFALNLLSITHEKHIEIDERQVRWHGGNSS